MVLVQAGLPADRGDVVRDRRGLGLHGPLRPDASCRRPGRAVLGPGQRRGDEMAAADALLISRTPCRLPRGFWQQLRRGVQAHRREVPGPRHAAVLDPRAHHHLPAAPGQAHRRVDRAVDHGPRDQVRRARRTARARMHERTRTSWRRIVTSEGDGRFDWNVIVAADSTVCTQDIEDACSSARAASDDPPRCSGRRSSGRRSCSSSRCGWAWRPCRTPRGAHGEPVRGAHDAGLHRRRAGVCGVHRATRMVPSGPCVRRQAKLGLLLHRPGGRRGHLP